MSLSKHPKKSIINQYFKLLRPRQWVKNGFVLAPLFFSLNFLDPASWVNALIAVLCFILVSSFVYIVNDINDVEEDKTHPIKKSRPIAAGNISPKEAVLLAFALLIVALGLTVLFLPLACFYAIFLYLFIQTVYTFILKNVAIFDVLMIALGFVLRLLMGGEAINVDISPWIIITTYLLALFLGFGKRFHEYSLDKYKDERLSLKRYNRALLDRLISITCVATLLSYTTYAVETATMYAKTELVYTVIFVIVGLFRYLQILYVDELGGEPDKILFTDKIFIANGLLWLILTILILI